jgi:hypothetical protein
MELGIRLRELARLRIGLALSFILAAMIAFSVTYKVTASPLGVSPRQMEIGTASTKMLVDTSKSLVLDIRYGSGDFDSLTSRGVLLGNLMASEPVRAYIARRAHLPAGVIQATTPLTPDFPRPLAGEGASKSQSDLFRSTDQYRLNIQANPTVPIVNVYAQAPNAKAAETLANAAVDGLRDYLAAATKGPQKAPAADQPLITQLGRANGTVINGGVRVEAILLTFGVVFALACAVTVFVGRVRRGWLQADALERTAARGAA